MAVVVTTADELKLLNYISATVAHTDRNLKKNLVGYSVTVSQNDTFMYYLDKTDRTNLQRHKFNVDGNVG